MKKRKKGLTKLEKLLYKFSAMLIIILLVGILIGQTTLSQINLDVQKLEKELEKQNNTNESLVMKINEMASLDNILTTSIEEGLAYNNENIKTITE